MAFIRECGTARSLSRRLVNLPNSFSDELSTAIFDLRFDIRALGDRMKASIVSSRKRLATDAWQLVSGLFTAVSKTPVRRPLAFCAFQM